MPMSEANWYKKQPPGSCETGGLLDFFETALAAKKV